MNEEKIMGKKKIDLKIQEIGLRVKFETAIITLIKVYNFV